MSERPYTPPASRVADRPEASPPFPRPKQVTVAVSLLWVSLALDIPVWFLAAARDQEMLNAGPLAFVVVLFAIQVTLYVFTYRGRNWARIGVLILFVLDGLVFLIPNPKPPGVLENTLDVVGLVMTLIALYLLFSRPGALWFRPRE
jgi:hypothetical protein